MALRLNLLLLSLIFTPIFNAQIIGVQAGVNLNSMKFEDNDFDYDEEFTSHTGYQFGITVEFPLSDVFSFETGLSYSLKGFRLVEQTTLTIPTVPPQTLNFSVEALTNPVFIDLPLNAKYYLNSGNVNFFGSFGPYLGYGTGGKIIAKVSALGQTEEEKQDINWGSDEQDDFKRFDYGINGGLGFELRSFQFKASYQFGLANISSFTGNGNVASNRVINFSLLYFISGDSLYDSPPAIPEDPYAK